MLIGFELFHRRGGAPFSRRSWVELARPRSVFVLLWARQSGARLASLRNPNSVGQPCFEESLGTPTPLRVPQVFGIRQSAQSLMLQPEGFPEFDELFQVSEECLDPDLRCPL